MACFDDGSSICQLLQRKDVEGQLQLLELLYTSYPSEVKQLLNKQPSCLPTVVSLLSSSNAVVQQQSARVLRRLGQAGEHIAEQVVLSKGAVRGLVAQLQGSIAAVQLEAASTLGSLAANRRIDWVDSLTQSDTRCDFDWEESLTQSDTRPHIDWVERLSRDSRIIGADTCKVIGADPGAVAGLVSLLSCSDAPMQREAAAALAALSKRADNRQHIAAEPGAIAGLAAVLSSSNADAQLAAVGALARLARESPAKERIGQEPGAISGLLALLSGCWKNIGLGGAAATAIANLAQDSPAMSQRIGHQRVVSGGLAALLCSRDEHASLAAALAVAHLALACPVFKKRAGQEPGVVPGLAALLSSHAAADAAALALGSLALGSPENSKLIGQWPGVVSGLLGHLTCGWLPRRANLKWSAAFAIASAAEGSSAFQEVLAGHSADVWEGLSYHWWMLEGHRFFIPVPQSYFVEVAHLLSRLATGSTILRESTVGRVNFNDLLTYYGQGVQVPVPEPDNVNGNAVEGLAKGTSAEGALAGACTHAAVTTVALSWGSGMAPSPSHCAQDAASAYDQACKTPNGPHGKLATTVEVLRMLETVGKMVPILSTDLAAFIKPLAEFLDRVEQVRVNKAKALSMKQRVEALTDLLVCMFKSGLQDALASNPAQLKVLQQQLKRLEDALWKAYNMVNKWSKPMRLEVVMRFLKANLDKDDIKEFESTVNKAVQDLSCVISALSLIHTLEGQQQLKEHVAKTHASDARLAQELDQAHLQDLQELQGQLEQLLGGQAELQQQLAAATEQQRVEWSTVTGTLEQLAGDFGVFRDEVRELTSALQVWMDKRTMPQASCSAPLVRSRLLLDRERVQWELDEMDFGGFASVYPGTYDGHDVAVKLLRLSAFSGEQEREQMFMEAAVLSRLNHPCIVHFWGVVPVEEGGKVQRGAAQGSTSHHGSAGSYSSSGSSLSPRSGNISSKLSLGLVMDRCDESLEMRLDAEPVLKLPAALHIAERIACGLKYLHSEAPVQVVHGDLKPANVLLKHGTHLVQLTDFGLSSTIAVHTMSMGARMLGHNRAQQSGLTLHWAAPELLDAWGEGRDAPHTLACDIYSFAIIMHQLLVGKMPYMSMFKAPEALKAAVRGGTRPSWADWEKARGGEAGSDVLGKLQALVEACWARSATQRPTAQQVHTQLVELKRLVPSDSASTV